METNNKSNKNQDTNTIKNIDNEILNNKNISQKRKVPYVYIGMILLAIISGSLSANYTGNDNLGFGFSFIAFTLAAIGVLGVLIPRKIFVYLPTNERIYRKQYYLNYDHAEEVQKHFVVDAVNDVVKYLNNLSSIDNNNVVGSSTIRVIVYYTHSGVYMSGQIHHYVPYEFVPMTRLVNFGKESNKTHA
jgi:hypothetical protein